jgi:general stress protein 26
MDQDAQQTIWDLAKKIGTCMLVTHTGEHIRARPMRAMVRAEQNAIWFVSDADSEKENEIANHPNACLAFVDLRGQSFVSLSGSIERVHDHAQVEALWNEGVEAYFPNGKDDPALVLLKFAPSIGEYWDAPSNPIVLAIKFLQAKVTAQRPDLGTNEKASLS